MMRSALYAGICVGLLLPWTGSAGPAAQDGRSQILINVVLVQLNVAVMDRKGNYVTGLRPENFQIKEDNISETISSFQEGGELQSAATMTTRDAAPEKQETDSSQEGMLPMASRLAGASVFVLFDTSDYMYRGFVYAQDAISGFVRSMQDADKIAFYSYSRNLSRATTLTADRSLVLNGLRSTVAGDQAALYNSLLLTVRDASQLRGRKAIVVFSNGPDDSSTVPPEDVEELAQSTGTIIYIISTRAANEDPLSTAAFQRMSKATGGNAYFAKDWRGEKAAFGSIRSDLAHLYTITYYPKANKNRGWRRITVRLVGKEFANDRVRTRDGYRVQEAEALPEPLAQEPAEGSN
jgi:VWFA-related protein